MEHTTSCGQEVNKRDILLNWGYEDSVVFDNPSFDSAIVGVSYEGRVIYDLELMVEHLMTSDGMTEEEALDFIDYNTARACQYIENSPIIMSRLTE